jgi:hypothetical protein
LEFFFDYLLNHYVRSEKYSGWFLFAFHEPNGKHSMFIKPIPSDITIIASWKGNELYYSNYILSIDLTNDYDEFDDISENSLFVRIIIPYYHGINFHERHYHFQGFIYSKKEYDELNRLERLDDHIAYDTICIYGSRYSNPFELFRYGDENFNVVQFLIN